MDLFDVVRSCIRRWYVVLPLLLIVAWYSHQIYASAKPVYYSSAVIGVAPPNTQVWIKLLRESRGSSERAAGCGWCIVDCQPDDAWAE